MRVHLHKLLGILMILVMVGSLTIINTEAKSKKKKNWIKLTTTEYNYLCRVVETETFCGTFEGKCDVASVVINRHCDKRYGGSIVKIITSPCQFAYGRTKISKSTKKAVNYVIKHGDTAKGAIAFHSNSKTNTFFGLKYIFTDNVGHHFYK